jgi:hypothetical protein
MKLLSAKSVLIISILTSSVGLLSSHLFINAFYFATSTDSTGYMSSMRLVSPFKVEVDYTKLVMHPFDMDESRRVPSAKFTYYPNIFIPIIVALNILALFLLRREKKA